MILEVRGMKRGIMQPYLFFYIDYYSLLHYIDRFIFRHAAVYQEGMYQQESDPEGGRVTGLFHNAHRHLYRGINGAEVGFVSVFVGDAQAGFCQEEKK